MPIEQYIIICLKDFTEEDPATYVQATRKRFSYEEAVHRAKGIAPSRDPRVVQVKYVRVGKDGYPIKTS